MLKPSRLRVTPVSRRARVCGGARRIRESIALLAAGKKLGLK